MEQAVDITFPTLLLLANFDQLLVAALAAGIVQCLDNPFHVTGRDGSSLFSHAGV